ncbi:hypothetical protein NDU88_003040 [Pleurodeles waltl]|uniref:Uncharacterized protein n=1 Tax=Pleurodeles waltl TaxID=8319 RepID=A0AAV7UEZ9_PLEWA|nr:hypothetical protein NDU88_003040 [Pleurodeles waltl]
MCPRSPLDDRELPHQGRIHGLGRGSARRARLPGSRRWGDVAGPMRWSFCSAPTCLASFFMFDDSVIFVPMLPDSGPPPAHCPPRHRPSAPPRTPSLDFPQMLFVTPLKPSESADIIRVAKEKVHTYFGDKPLA